MRPFLASDPTAFFYVLQTERKRKLGKNEEDKVEGGWLHSEKCSDLSTGQKRQCK